MAAKLLTNGAVIPYTPIASVSKGTFVKLGAILGVVNLAINAGEQGSIVIGHYWCAPKKSGAVFTTGARAYVKLSTQEITDSALDDFLGVYISDNIHDSSFVNVRLNEFFGLTNEDDFIEVANYAALPVTGTTKIIYVTVDDNKTYRWTGSTYVEISAGGGAGLVDGDYGDITVGGTGTTMTIDAGVVDNAKLATVPTLTIKGKNTAGTGAPLDLTVTQVKTMLDINGSIADLSFTQPSASPSWTLVHGRAISPNFAFFNALNEREYPLEDHSVAGQVSLTFGVAEIHTATLPGNGTSASLRGDAILSLTGTAINAASGVIDIASTKTVIIDVDVAITFAITFSTTPADSTPLKIKYKKGATPFTASVDAAKFKDSVTSVHPSPMLLATANTEDVFDYLFSSTSGKMVLMGFNLGG